MITSSVADTLGVLGLTRPPVAVAFLDRAPEGLPRIERPLAAGCGYWKHAADGHAFVTAAEDHYNCPVGSFTHGVALPPAKAEELQSLVGTMIQLHYLREEEVAGIPRREQPLEFVAYAPWAEATFAPDLVIFRGNARQIMILSEAARAAGVFEQGTALGRPACAMIPYTLQRGAGVASIGCIGNRVYTELGDDELYIAVPAAALEGVLSQLPTIATANAELEKFHRQRAATLG